MIQAQFDFGALGRKLIDGIPDIIKSRTDERCPGLKV